MGYYVVVNTNTLSDLYITSTENEAKIFKYNYEYTHYGTHCKIKYIEQKFEEFPKVLYVEAAGLTTINVVSNEIESSYNWIYNYKPLDESLKETDEYILSKENVKILKKEINEKLRNQNTELVDIRCYIEYYLKTIVGESPEELVRRIKEITGDIIKKDIMTRATTEVRNE